MYHTISWTTGRRRRNDEGETGTVVLRIGFT